MESSFHVKKFYIFDSLFQFFSLFFKNSKQILIMTNWYGFKSNSINWFWEKPFPASVAEVQLVWTQLDWQHWTNLHPKKCVSSGFCSACRYMRGVKVSFPMRESEFHTLLKTEQAIFSLQRIRLLVSFLWVQTCILLLIWLLKVAAEQRLYIQWLTSNCYTWAARKFMSLSSRLFIRKTMKPNYEKLRGRVR